MMYNFMGGWVALSLNPFFITLMTYFHQGIPQIAWLVSAGVHLSIFRTRFCVPWPDTNSSVQTSALLLTLGFANLITVPMAVCYGRRSAYLWSMVVTLVTTLWAAGTKSYNSFLAARILMGVGTAGIETLGAVTITDVFFLHERGSLNTIYLYVEPPCSDHMEQPLLMDAALQSVAVRRFRHGRCCIWCHCWQLAWMALVLLDNSVSTGNIISMQKRWIGIDEFLTESSLVLD